MGLAMAVGGMNESVVLGVGERGKGVGWSDSVDAVQSSSLASKPSSCPSPRPAKAGRRAAKHGVRKVMSSLVGDTRQRRQRRQR